ncbi:DUF4031 domain-containing protein [Kytococcus sedentarius]|uniref:HD domain-containing protein n=1 Tax=Kytococcus sedentarius TaxID=1276 RepID=UPI0035BBD92F
MSGGLSGGGLAGRWADLLGAVTSAPSDEVRAAGAGLLARWDETHRGYHDRQHLAEVLAALDELVGAEAGERAGQAGGGVDGMDSAAAQDAELALWFHDAVYRARAGAGRNEADSADLARSVLGGLGVDAARCEEVARLVLLTTDHRVDDPADTAGQLVCDADLWILAAPPARYASYTAAVRREYRHVPGPLFRRGRRSILEALVESGTPYVTAHARQVWGPRALENVRAEIQRLS